MFPNKSTDTFEKINSYIEKNKIFWDEHVNKKLSEKYNEQILKLLEQRFIFKDSNNTEPLKFFMQITKMTIEGIHNHKRLMDHFIPWFLKNGRNDIWNEQTNKFKNQKLLQKYNNQILKLLGEGI